MSLETWKAEFYPIAACDTKEEDAITHSLQKWKGLTPYNLTKHNVRLTDYAWVIDPETSEPNRSTGLKVDGDSCSLCHHFLLSGDEYEDSACETCPLYKARDGVACDQERDDEEEAPWYEFRSETANPTPMIFWLEKTLELNPTN